MARKPNPPVSPSDPNQLDRQPPAPEKKKRSRWLYILGAIAVLFICGIISSFFTDDAADDPEPTAEVAQSAATPQPTDTPAPTATPAPPTATPEPGEALRAAVAGALGNSNRGVERLVSVVDANGRIEVDWAINDNLSEDLTRGGAQLEAVDILKAIVASGYEYDFILMRGTFPLRDTAGNVEESKVVELFFSRETVNGFDFGGFFDHRNIYELADSAQIHPAFVGE